MPCREKFQSIRNIISKILSHKIQREQRVAKCEFSIQMHTGLTIRLDRYEILVRLYQ